MTDAMAMSTWPLHPLYQSSLDFLCLSLRNLLSIVSFNNLDDIGYGSLRSHRHESGDGFHQELHLSRFRALDILMGRPLTSKAACMDIVDDGNTGVTSLGIVVGSDAKGAIGRRAAAGANTMAVAIENVWREVALDGPLSQSFFEIGKTGKCVARLDGEHVVI